MSKQKSLVKFQGKMDGISFYETKGGHFARMAKGPSRQRILTDPKFKRTRENLTEFTSLALARKLFRSSVRSVSNLTDGELHLRLSTVFRGMAKRSDGIRGQRPVAVSQNRDVLKNLELNTLYKFAAICPVRVTPAHPESRTSGSLAVQPFVPAEMITAQPTATHFRLVQLLSLMPDVVFRPESGKYESVDTFYDGLHEISFSDYVDVSSTQQVTLTLETSLGNAPPPGPNVSVMQGLGIIFYEQIGAIHYPLSQGNGMQLVDIF